MTEISLLGLGAMGAALARAQLKAGHEVTVWNRSPRKTAPLVALGAKGAAGVADAVQASPVIMICIDNYAATKTFLEADDVAPHLSDRTVIQLSTGTPREARDAEAWLNGRGASYLDGAIMAYPDSIGDAGTMILMAGAKAPFERCAVVLQCLGGNIRYLGENIAAPAALDMAVLSHSLGEFVGFAHGARLCEAEGVGADLVASMFAQGERARELAEIVHAGAYALGSLHPGATIRVWEGVVQRLQSQAGDAGMTSEVPDFISGVFKRAVAAGHGEEDVAALIKVLRDGKEC